MAVDTFDPQQFDPSRQSQSLDAGQVADALRAARDQVSGAPEVSLSAEQVSGLAALVVHAGWSAAAALPAHPSHPSEQWRLAECCRPSSKTWKLRKA